MYYNGTFSLVVRVLLFLIYLCGTWLFCQCLHTLAILFSGTSCLWCFFVLSCFFRPLSARLPPFPFYPCSRALSPVRFLFFGCTSSFPLPLSLSLLSPRVSCLVLLAVDWLRISSTALSAPLSLFVCGPSPPLPWLLPCFAFVPVWYFWP